MFPSGRVHVLILALLALTIAILAQDIPLPLNTNINTNDDTTPTSQTFPHHAYSNSQPDDHMYTNNVNNDLNELEVLRLPQTPRAGAWAYFTFLPRNAPIEFNKNVIFTLNRDLSPGQTIPPFPRPVFSEDSYSFDRTDNSFPHNALPLPSMTEDCVCTAFDRRDGNEVARLTPMCAGRLARYNLDDDFSLVFSPSQPIPAQWAVSCFAHYSYKVDDLQLQQQLRDPPVTLVVDPWKLINTVPLSLPTDPLQHIIWTDLQVGYEADVVLDSAEPIDRLSLTFRRLPPHLVTPLDIALDVVGTNSLDRVAYFSTTINDIIARMVAMTAFPAQLEAQGARLVFERVATYKNQHPGSWYLITDGAPAQDITFSLPIPRNEVIKHFVSATNLARDFTAWHNQQIAVYVKTMSARLFKHETTEPKARWNLFQESFHRNYNNVTRHIMIDRLKSPPHVQEAQFHQLHSEKPSTQPPTPQTLAASPNRPQPLSPPLSPPLSLEQASLDSPSTNFQPTRTIYFTWDVILIGPSPSIHLINDLPPFYYVSKPASTSTSALADPPTLITLQQLFTPIAQGGFLATSHYINQPYFLHDKPTPIPITLYNHTTSQRPLIQFGLENPDLPYHGYANITLSFVVTLPIPSPTSPITPPLPIPMNLQFLLNQRYPLTLTNLNQFLIPMYAFSYDDPRDPTQFSTSFSLSLRRNQQIAAERFEVQFDSQGRERLVSQGRSSSLHSLINLSHEPAAFVNMTFFLSRFVGGEPRSLEAIQQFPKCRLLYFELIGNSESSGKPFEDGKYQYEQEATELPTNNPPKFSHGSTQSSQAPIPARTIYSRYNLPYPGSNEDDDDGNDDKFLESVFTYHTMDGGLQDLLSVDMRQSILLKVLLPSTMAAEIRCTYTLREDALRQGQADFLSHSISSDVPEVPAVPIPWVYESERRDTHPYPGPGPQPGKLVHFTFMAFDPITTPAQYRSFLETVTEMANKAVYEDFIKDNGKGETLNANAEPHPLAKVTINDWFIPGRHRTGADHSAGATLDSSDSFPLYFGNIGAFNQSLVKLNPSPLSLSGSSSSATVMLLLNSTAFKWNTMLRTFFPSRNKVFLARDPDVVLDIPSLRAVDLAVGPDAQPADRTAMIYDGVPCLSSSQCFPHEGIGMCLKGVCRSRSSGIQLEMNEFLDFVHYRQQTPFLSTISFLSNQSSSESGSNRSKTVFVVIIVILVVLGALGAAFLIKTCTTRKWQKDAASAAMPMVSYGDDEPEPSFPPTQSSISSAAPNQLGSPDAKAEPLL